MFWRQNWGFRRNQCEMTSRCENRPRWTAGSCSEDTNLMTDRAIPHGLLYNRQTVLPSDQILMRPLLRRPLGTHLLDLQ